VTESPFGPPGSSAGLDGTVADAHTWTSPAIYHVTLTVVDDDGGSGVTTTDVEVVDPIEALARIVSDLHALADDPDVGEALRDLEGAPAGGPPNSGALDKLADGDDVAAVRKIVMALEHLADAEVDTGLAELVLTQIAASIAAELEHAAIAAADPTAPGDVRQLATIASLMSDGRMHLASENWIVAADSFHEAARRADNLL
jgi:PKD repeat protein